ncbi:hypothetical protein [Ferrovibrio sp.]|uniref:hypothetical protein n=1 Tax=Ferrovibrio sp. TaxID=1917215 RepID=UPI0025C575F1|nr:hypothetical protein [Ferrovibrio sp.]MBX3455233.1 hypothetical protein [Ferrovibrio sp.]
MKMLTAVASALFGLALLAPVQQARADVFAHGGLCLANNGGKAVMAPCSMSRHNNNIRYVPNENVFFGQLQQGSQCLEMNRSGQVFFATCNFSKFQEWKFSGNGQFNNADPGMCIVPSGNSVVGRPCPAAGWVNLSYTVVRVPNMNAPRGTVLAIRGADLINKQTGAIVASGGGNIVSGGAGNIVASGGGNIVSGGAGNVIAAGGKYSLGAVNSIVAGGAGN